MWSRFKSTLFTPGDRRREYQDMFTQHSYNGGGFGYPDWVFAQTGSREETRDLSSRQRVQSAVSVWDEVHTGDDQVIIDGEIEILNDRIVIYHIQDWDGSLDSGEDVTGQARLDGKSLPQVGSSKLGVSMGPDVVNMFSVDCQGGMTIMPDSPVGLRLRIPSVTKLWDFAMGQIALPLQDCRMSDGGPADFFTQNPEDFNTRFNIGTFDFWYSLVGQDRNQLNMGPPLPHGANDTRALLMEQIFNNSTLESIKSFTGVDFSDFSVKFPGTCSLTTYLATGHCEMHVDVHKLQFFHVNLTVSPRTHWDVSFNIHINRCYDHPFAPPRFDFGCYGSDCHMLLEPYHATPFFCQQDSDCEPNFERTNGGAPAQCQLLNDFIDKPPIIFKTVEENQESLSACTRSIFYDVTIAKQWTRDQFETAWAQAAMDAQCIVQVQNQLKTSTALTNSAALKTTTLAQLREEKHKQKQKEEKEKQNPSTTGGTTTSTGSGNVAVTTNQANQVAVTSPVNVAYTPNTPTDCLTPCQRGLDWWRKQFVWTKPFDGSGVAQVQEMPIIMSNQISAWGNDAVPFYLFDARMQSMYYCYDWDCGNGVPNTAPWGQALTQATYGYSQQLGCCVCNEGWTGNHCTTPFNACEGMECPPDSPFPFLFNGQCTCGVQCTRENDCGGRGDPTPNSGYLVQETSPYHRCQCTCDQGFTGYDCYPNSCSLKCQNNGYPDASCSYCICPPDDGMGPVYGGQLCDKYACGQWTCNFNGQSNNSILYKDQTSSLDTLESEPHPECLPCHCNPGWVGTYCDQQPPTFLVTSTSTTSTADKLKKSLTSFGDQVKSRAQYMMKMRGLEVADEKLMEEAKAATKASVRYSWTTNETSPDWPLASLIFHSIEYQYSYNDGGIEIPPEPTWLASNNMLDCSGPSVPFCIAEQRYGWDCNICDGSARATAHFLQWVNSAANNDFSSPPASSLNNGVTIGFCAPAIYNIDVNEPGNNQTAVDFVNGLKNGTVDGLVAGVFPCNASLTNHTVDAYGFSYACDCLPGYYDENNNLNCLPMPCDALPDAVPNGHYDPQACLNVPSGTVCELSCDGGYQAANSPTCLYGSWAGDPVCIPATCGPLGDLSGDRSSSCSDSTVNTGETCVLMCNEGTTLQGEANPNLICTPNEGQPTSSFNTDQINSFICQPNSCDVTLVKPQPSAESGAYVPPDILSNNGVLDIACNPGYVRNGGDFTCRYGVISGESPPSCTPASCSPLPADLGNSRHASCSETDATLGSICTLSCDKGTMPFGNPNVECIPITACTGAAEWNSTAINLFSCSMRPCDISSFPPPSGGSYFPSITLAQDAQLFIVCDPGYLVNAGSAVCDGGVVTGTLPTCTPTQCAPLTPVGDRLASCTTPQPIGSWCLLSCVSGATASGKANATCMGMGGSGSGIAQYDPTVLNAFTCSPNPCNVSALLSNAAHGSYVPYAEALLPSGSAVSITCNPGYTVVMGMAMCSHGQVVGALPSCTPGFCAPLPHSLGADRFSSCSSPQPLGSTCQLSCTTGASANGDGILPCIGIVGAAEYNTTILNDFACTPNPCTLSGNPKGGVYVPSPSIANNQAVTVVCDPGYATLAGSAVCHYGTITGTLPACTPSSCAPLPQALGGDRLTDTACHTGPQTLGSVCGLSCVAGSVANGDPKAYCVGVPGCNGAAQYNLTVLMQFTCTPNSCNISSQTPANIKGGHYAPYPGVANGVALNAVCDDGYTATPAVMCNHGVLTGALPTCVPSQCAPLSSVGGNAYFGVNTTSCGSANPGATCVLTCLPGFHRIDWGTGTNVSALCTGVCAGQAAWKHDEFVCAPNDCATLPVPPVGGSYPTCSCGTVRHLHACNLTCDPGYTHFGIDPLCVGGTFVNSNENGCAAAVCPAIASPGLHACKDSPTGSMCNATCDAGYQRVNSADPAWEILDCKGTSTGSSTWTPRLDALTCAEKPCAGKSNPKGGSYNKQCLQTVVPPGTVCNLTCDLRFYNVVNQISKCQLGAYTTDQNCVDKVFSSSSAPWSSSPYSSSAPYSSSSVHGSNAFVLECGQQLTEVMDKFPLLSLSDTVTQNVLMKCHNPVQANESCDPLPVWGTYDYTLDSDICTAIRHVASSWDAEVWVTLSYQEMRPSGDRIQVFSPSLRNDVQTLPWVEAYPITFHLSENEPENPPPMEFPAFREKSHHSSHSSSNTKAASSRSTPLYRHTVNRDYTATQLAEWRSRTAKGKPLSHYDRQLLITNKAAAVASARTSGNTHRRDHLQPEVIDDNLVAPSFLEIAFTHARHVRDYLTGRSNPAEATPPQATSPRASSQQSNQDQLQPSADPQQRFRNNRKT